VISHFPILKLCQLIAKYDYKTIYSILTATFFSDVSFIVADEDGEPSPYIIPITAVAGKFNPCQPLPEDDGDEEEYVQQQDLYNEQPFDVYLHGNAAMLLSKMSKTQGPVKVAVSSTKGTHPRPYFLISAADLFQLTAWSSISPQTATRLTIGLV